MDGPRPLNCLSHPCGLFEAFSCSWFGWEVVSITTYCSWRRFLLLLDFGHCDCLPLCVVEGWRCITRLAGFLLCSYVRHLGSHVAPFCFPSWKRHFCASIPEKCNTLLASPPSWFSHAILALWWHYHRALRITKLSLYRAGNFKPKIGYRSDVYNQRLNNQKDTANLYLSRALSCDVTVRLSPFWMAESQKAHTESLWQKAPTPSWKLA